MIAVACKSSRFYLRGKRVFCREKGTEGLVYAWSFELERNLQHDEMTETYQRRWSGERFHHQHQFPQEGQFVLFLYLPKDKEHVSSTESV